MDQEIAEVMVRKKKISSETPCICTPIVGRSYEQLMVEMDSIHSSPNLPDLVEWRVDFFEKIRDHDAIVSTLTDLREKLNDIPLLFTIRAEEEGGQKVGLSHPEKVTLLEQIVKSGHIDMLDFESFHDASYIQRLRQATKSNDVKLVISYHNFHETPSLSFMLKKLLEAEFYDADIAKLAVMPLTKKDVLTLLTVTEEANRLMNIPLITMSMGNYGSLSRMFGWVFGSSISFGVRDKASAPGQIPLDDLKDVMAYTKKAVDRVK